MMAASATLAGDAGLTGATALAVPSVSMIERQDVACVSGSTILLHSFNQWIDWARQDLTDLPPADEAPRSRVSALKHARKTLTNALTAANRLGCPGRKAVCLRVLNWINADLRRLPE